MDKFEESDIQLEIQLVQEELRRVKDFVNSGGFDVTTATFFIVQQYRNSLKQHLNNLYGNIQSDKSYEGG
jgi:hypothetical protein